MDPKAETRIARDVEKCLSRLANSSPRLAKLPIAPLFSVRDLIRLEIALERFAQTHTSTRSKRLVEGVRTVLSVGRARLRIATAGRRASIVAAATSQGEKLEESPRLRP
jgi:hypothetical protein